MAILSHFEVRQLALKASTIDTVLLGVTHIVSAMRSGSKGPARLNTP